MFFHQYCQLTINYLMNIFSLYLVSNFIFFQGKEIIEYFVNELAKDGITEVPLWQESGTDDVSTKSEDGSGSESLER